MMSEMLAALLETAVHAPSGHNYQPWRFKVSGDSLSIFNVPENDRTIYNFKQRGSYIGNGAVIENIVLLATAERLATKISLFPSGEDADLVARIDFSNSTREIAAEERVLVEAIRERSTNRKNYRPDRLTSRERDSLESLPESLWSAGSVAFVEDPDAVGSIAKAWSINDWLIFNARAVHDALFPHIVWTKSHEAEKRSGLFIDTLELDPPVRVLFNIFKRWWLARLLGRLGFGSFVARENQKRYARAGAIGGILVPDTTPASFVNAGRILQRTWLRATSLRLSLQPLLGALYLDDRIREEGSEAFTRAQQQRIARAGAILREAFSGATGTLVFTFRIGRADRPSAQSSKKKPIIERN